MANVFSDDAARKIVAATRKVLAQKGAPASAVPPGPQNVVYVKLTAESGGGLYEGTEVKRDESSSPPWSNVTRRTFGPDSADNCIELREVNEQEGVPIDSIVIAWPSYQKDETVRWVFASGISSDVIVARIAEYGYGEGHEATYKAQEQKWNGSSWEDDNDGLTFEDGEAGELLEINGCPSIEDDTVVYVFAVPIDDSAGGIQYCFDGEQLVPYPIAPTYDDDATNVTLQEVDVYLPSGVNTVGAGGTEISLDAATEVWIEITFPSDNSGPTVNADLQTGEYPGFYDAPVGGTTTICYLVGEVNADHQYISYLTGDLHLPAILPPGDAEGDTLRWDAGNSQWEDTSLFQVGNDDSATFTGVRIWDLEDHDTQSLYVEAYHDGTDGYLGTKDADGGDLHLQATAHDDVWLFKDAESGDTPSLKQSGFAEGDQKRTWRQSVGEDAENSVSRYFDGTRCYWLDAATYNLGVGLGTLVDVTSGEKNTALGYQSLFNNTTGSYTTAMGYQSLFYNTEGSYLTAVGYQSLYSNTTGERNTATGFFALYSNTTGARNTAAGYRAGDNITTGSDNIFIGYDLDASAADATHEFRLGNSNSNTTPLLHGELDNVNLILGYGDENNDYPTFEIHGKPAGDALQKFQMQHSPDAPNFFLFVQDTEVETTVQKLGGDSSTYSWQVARSDGKEVLAAVADWTVRLGYGATEAAQSTVLKHYGYASGGDSLQLVEQEHTGDGIYSYTATTDVEEFRFVLGGTSEMNKWGVYDSAGQRQLEAAGDGDVYVESRLGVGADPTYPLYVYADSAERLRVQDDGTLRVNNEYDMPTEDGSENDIMKTDGADTVSWTSLTSLLTTLTDYASGNDQVLFNDESTISWENLNPSTNVDTVGDSDEGDESADATTWTAGGTNGLELYVMTRVGYYDAGNETLYGYIRNITFSRTGNLYSVGAETRIAIDTPGTC